MRVRRVTLVAVSLALAGGTLGGVGPALAAPASSACADIVPAPVTATATAGVTVTLRPDTVISTDTPAVGEYLAAVLRGSTGFALPVRPAGAGTPNGIALLLSGAPAATADEGYQLDVTGKAVVLRARKAAGLFEGVQTLRQLLPPAIEAPTVQHGPWTVPGGHVLDFARFPYRGAMLDVARHFFTVSQVERYIDEVARYKVNRFHVHLSDDQGWRIAINGWERLATFGGGTQVGDPNHGGFYTQADYRALVTYAAARFITVVPEIDMPGHTNAALASYAQLNCNGAAQHGTKLVLSPANHAYLDMKYTAQTPLGQDWAGLTDVKKAYGWNPGAYLSGVPSSAVLGVEAPLWTETILTSANIEFMAFPRLPAIAELGWSPQSTHAWGAFKLRLAAQGPRWKAAGMTYYHSTQVPWPAGA